MNFKGTVSAWGKGRGAAFTPLQQPLTLVLPGGTGAHGSRILKRRERRAPFGEQCRDAARARPGRVEAGHTMVELMVAMGIFSLMLAAILACYFAGLQFNQFVQPKIQNNQYSRQTLGRLIEEVRCANSIQVGTGTLTNFVPVGTTNLQTGNALRIYPSTNLTQYVYYFHDAPSSTVQKVTALTSNALSAFTAVTISTAVTNHSIFSMQDFSGNTLTNNQNNAVMNILLQMRRNSKMQGFTDAYQVSAKITRRNIL